MFCICLRLASASKQWAVILNLFSTHLTQILLLWPFHLHLGFSAKRLWGTKQEQNGISQQLHGREISTPPPRKPMRRALSLVSKAPPPSSSMLPLFRVRAASYDWFLWSEVAHRLWIPSPWGLLWQEGNCLSEEVKETLHPVDCNGLGPIVTVGTSHQC